MPPISPLLIQRFSALAEEETGIKLGPDKADLVSARITRRLRQLNLSDPKDYWALLQGPQGREELQGLINSLTTNVTRFFREPAHFELMKDYLRALPLHQPLRIWCAAASTGEEPWTLAITALEAMGGATARDIRILSTDIDTEVLQTASRGLYPHAAGQIPPDILTRYFEPAAEGWRVGATLRGMMSFARLNLAQPPFPMRGPFDVIFCRNVMIYFGAQTRQGIVSEVERMLRPGGLFCVGHSESLQGLKMRMQVLQPAAYITPSKMAAAA